MTDFDDNSALEDAIKRHSGGSVSSAFSGRGQTLGGAPAPADIAGDVKDSVNKATTHVTNLDPQVKVLLALVGAYVLFWWLS